MTLILEVIIGLYDDSDQPEGSINATGADQALSATSQPAIGAGQALPATSQSATAASQPEPTGYLGYVQLPIIAPFVVSNFLSTCQLANITSMPLIASTDLGMQQIIPTSWSRPQSSDYTRYSTFPDSTKYSTFADPTSESWNESNWRDHSTSTNHGDRPQEDNVGWLYYTWITTRL